MRFYVGLYNATHAWPFARSMFSMNVLWDRMSGFKVNKWILDSGAFTQIRQYGRFLMEPKWYAWRIEKLSRSGQLVAAVIQDWMCEPSCINKTGKSKEEHQELTVKSYVELQQLVKGTRLMPVLQGYYVKDYVRHLKEYGDLLKPGAWVGVGCLASRNHRVGIIEAILEAIKSERSDLHLHGFGLKTSSLSYSPIPKLLYSCDSVAWSLAGRWQEGSKGANDPRSALAYALEIGDIVGDDIIYGTRNNPKQSLLSVDERETFYRAIRARSNNNNNLRTESINDRAVKFSKVY